MLNIDRYARGSRALVTTAIVAAVAGPVAAQDSVLTVWAENAPQAEEIMEAAKAVLGIEYEVTAVPYADLQGQFTQAVSAGNSPDLIISSCGLQQTWASQNLLAPVDLGEAGANMDPAALLAGNWDGQTVCVPSSIQSIAMHRNTDLVAEAQTTWDQVVETCANWPDDGTYCIAFSDSDDFDMFHVFPVLTAYGGYLFGYENGAWDTANVGVNDPGTQAAITMMAELVASGKAVATTTEQVMGLFSDGKVGLWITGSWNTVNLPAEGLNYTVEASPAGPAGPGRPFINSRGVYVSGSAPNLALAQVFIRNFWLTEDAMRLFQVLNGAPTPWIPLQGTDPEMAGFQAASAGGEPIPQVDVMGKAWALWSAPLKSAFNNGPGVVAEATETAHQAIVNLVATE